MSLKSVNRGNRSLKNPGTSNQTGNTAPRFQWPHAVRVIIACIAYHLDHTDDEMGRLRKFPKGKELYTIFVKTLPWFEEFYNSSQLEAAERKEYEGQLEKFNYSDVYNRLHYLYSKPGRKGNSPQSRKYGISVEHHDSVEQSEKRKIVFARCSIEVMRRLKMGKTISRKDVERWSKL